MKHFFLRQLFLTTLAVWGCTSSSADTIDEVRSAHSKAFTAGMLEEKLESVVSSFAENGRVMPEYQETGLGKEQISQYYEAFFERFDTKKFIKTTDEVLNLGHLIVEIGSFQTDLIVAETSEEKSLTGTYFDVWETQEDGSTKLFSSAWNYDAAFDGIRSLMHFSDIESTPAQRIPGITVSDELSYEVSALSEFNDVLMKRQQPETLMWIYAEDAAYAPHDAPIVKGRDAIAAFLKNYTSYWVPFDFVDVSVDRLDKTQWGAISYTSYNLRWIGGDQTGVATGKGIRIWKRSKDGQLQSFRQIAMHDF